jgi:hypothetical protein
VVKLVPNRKLWSEQPRARISSEQRASCDRASFERASSATQRRSKRLPSKPSQRGMEDSKGRLFIRPTREGDNPQSNRTRRRLCNCTHLADLQKRQSGAPRGCPRWRGAIASSNAGQLASSHGYKRKHRTFKVLRVLPFLQGSMSSSNSSNSHPPPFLDCSPSSATIIPSATSQRKRILTSSAQSVQEHRYGAS